MLSGRYDYSYPVSLPLFTYREFDQYQSSRRPTLTPTHRENNFTVYCLSRIFTAAAGCNCLVYTLSLNTPSESLRHWSSRDNCLLYFVTLTPCLLRVSRLPAPVRVRPETESDSDTRPLSPAPAMMR